MTICTVRGLFVFFFRHKAFPALRVVFFFFFLSPASLCIIDYCTLLLLDMHPWCLKQIRINLMCYLRKHLLEICSQQIDLIYVF